MKAHLSLAASIAFLAACATAPADPAALPAAAARPLDILPADASPGLVHADLLATAADRYGAAALADARAAPAYLIVKRFAGMAPPPPPGAGIDWKPVPAAALLVRREGGWEVASAGGWRPADPGRAAEIERIVAGAAFPNDRQVGPPCPDYGAALSLVKVAGQAETVRIGRCPGPSSQLVEAALHA